MSYLPPVLFAVIWMWSDQIGSLFSVISTYFYFGWEDVPQRVPKIFALALLAFSSPVAYRLVVNRISPRRFIQGGLVLHFGLYVGLSLLRQPDLFAWGSVFSVWWGGLLIMACFRQLAHIKAPSLAFFSVALGFLAYLSTRVALAGLSLQLFGLGFKSFFSWVLLTLAVLAGVLTPELRPESEAEQERPYLGSGSLGLCFGLLMGMSVGLILNLHIWSAQTPEAMSGAYFLPLALGLALSWWGVYSAFRWRLVSLIAASLALGWALYVLLYTSYSMAMGLLSMGLGVFGLSLFWAVFLERYMEYQRRYAYFPWQMLQLGFVALLLILALFLLQANPNGFWVALGLSSLLLLGHAVRAEAPEALTPRLKRLWGFVFILFALFGGLAAALPQHQPSAETAVSASQDDVLRVMTTNIRYGWTDDYRFDPRVHVSWLKNRLPDLMGVQELNKGHTSAAYTDLYRYYQQRLQGQWYYGDANYGFGNALYSRLPVKSVELREFSAKDMLKRSCLKAVVEFQGQELNVFVSHLSHLPPPNPVRTQQAQELIRWIRESQRPWIFMADTNAKPEAPEMQLLIQEAHPVFTERPELLQEYTYPSIEPQRRIDYVLFSSDFELQGMQVIDNQGTTDHRPVWAELKLKAEKTNSQSITHG